MRSNTKSSFRRPYFGEVELFAIWCPDTGGIYAVPTEEAFGTLRVDPPANNQVKGIRWASDYELPA